MGKSTRLWMESVTTQTSSSAVSWEANVGRSFSGSGSERSSLSELSVVHEARTSSAGGNLGPAQLSRLSCPGQGELERAVGLVKLEPEGVQRCKDGGLGSAVGPGAHRKGSLTPQARV